MLNEPLEVGVPPSDPVEGLKVTPPGKAPLSPSTGAGKPVAVTTNAAAEPAVKVALLTLVIDGAWFTVRVKLCETLPAGLLAVMEKLKMPPAAGVPLNKPVAGLRVTPLGSAPLSLNDIAG